MHRNAVIPIEIICTTTDKRSNDRFFHQIYHFVKHNHNNEPNSYLSSRNARLTIDLKHAPSHITNVS